jgi:hypothetical protein
MSCVLELLMTIDVVLVVLGHVLWGCLYPSFYTQGGEVTRKVTESVTTSSQLGPNLYLPILYLFL